MDWESKFSSIVRETESNLAKVKNKLGSARISSQTALSLNGFNHSAIEKPDPFYLSAHSDPGQGLTYGDSDQAMSGAVVRTNRPSLYGLGLTSGIVAEHEPLSLDHSPAVAALLHEKLEEQSRAIDSLTRTVRRLEEERDLYQRHFKDLRDEMSLLQSRMVERGIDLATERKVEQWRRDMMAELQVLQGQVQIHRSHDNSISAISAASREVNHMRREAQQECDSIRRDLDSLKGRLVKVELEQTSKHAENRDLNRRQDRLEQGLMSQPREGNQDDLIDNPLVLTAATQSLRGMRDTYNATSRDASHTQDDVDNNKLQITELKSSIRDLLFKLEDIENRIQPNSQPSAQKKTTHSALKKSTQQLKFTRPSAAELLSPNTSDLDLSDTELDDLQSSELSLSQINKHHRPTSGLDEDWSLDDLTYSEDLLSAGLDTEDLV